MAGMNEQPGLFLNKSNTLLTVTLGGYTGLCLMEVDGVRELRDRLNNLLSDMEGMSEPARYMQDNDEGRDVLIEELRRTLYSGTGLYVIAAARSIVDHIPQRHHANIMDNQRTALLNAVPPPDKDTD